MKLWSLNNHTSHIPLVSNNLATSEDVPLRGVKQGLMGVAQVGRLTEEVLEYLKPQNTAESPTL